MSDAGGDHATGTSDEKGPPPAENDQRNRAIQPPHWKAEVLAVMARKEPERIEGAQKLLFSIPCRDCDSASLYERAAQLSVQLKHHLFDTLYHAAALEHEATLITADEIYFAKARRLGNIKLLSNSTP